MVSLWPLLLTLLLTVLPVSTDARPRRIPSVTLSLLALNVLTFLYTTAHPDAFNRWQLLPASSGNGMAHTLLTLLTSLFLHVGWLHLLGNLWFLWLFGPPMEDAIGKRAFLLLYLGGGLTAGLLHLAIAQLDALRGATGASLVGASGAISAILAPFAVRFHRAHVRVFGLPLLLLPGRSVLLDVPAVAGLVLWLLLNVVGGLYLLFVPGAGGTDYWAHLGGFAFGLLAAQAAGLLREGRQDYLLSDARAAAGRGQELLTDAVARYRAFLERQPENAAVRFELACALAQTADGRPEAQNAIAQAIRLWQKQGAMSDAFRGCRDARALGLSLPLSARERLRLAGAAETEDADTARWLYTTLLRETPDAPEDEMARFKLGRLLLREDPAAARGVLMSLLEKYPDSAWTAQARDLLQQTHV